MLKIRLFGVLVPLAVAAAPFLLAGEAFPFKPGQVVASAFGGHCSPKMEDQNSLDLLLSRGDKKAYLTRFSDLLELRRAFLVDKGTKILVIGEHRGYAFVRLLGGRYMNERCYQLPTMLK